MFKYDMHVHTESVSSCGQVKAAETVNLYKKAGYQGLVITDHFYENFCTRFPQMSWTEKIDEYMKGYRKAKKAARKLGMDIILAMELRFTEMAGDFLVYGIDEAFLKENKNFHRGSLPEFKKRIDRQNKEILIYQAHPFRNRNNSAGPQFLDGVEVFNGNPRQDNNNQLALAFAEKHDLQMISGSDFHQIEDLARGGIITSEPFRNTEELLKVLKNDLVEKLIKNELGIELIY